MKLTVNKEEAVEVLRLVQEIIDKTGVRLAGTSTSKKAVEIIYEKLKQYCDSVKIEEFKFAREAFLSFMKILAITYPLGLVFLLIDKIWLYLSAILLTSGAVITFFEFVLYKELIDIFFKKFTGYNVVGIIEPKKEAKQNIIISAHYDSAYVFNFFKKWQKMYAPRIAIGVIIYYFAFFFVISCLIYKFLTGNNPDIPDQIKYIFLCGIPFVIQFYFFKSKEISPGAGDDLVGCAIGIKLAEIYGKAKKNNNPVLEHTRLTILITDAEESGLRGARNYVKKHREELKSLPTFNFNIDNIYNLGELSFLTSDINGTVKLSKKMVDECINIAEDLGYKITSAPMTFGGGATDAGEFSRTGIEAVSLIGMENKFIRDNLVYHTLNDTPDKIELEAVLACLNIVKQYILTKDQSYC